jgi:DeoR family transcriptional regulator of aga operon/DeoR family fructose operon transcriptional repressor
VAAYVTEGIGPTAGDVFARERRDSIARLVNEQRRARVSDLASRFEVSAVTVRKDLLVLQGEGRVVRTHGGAIAARERPTEGPFDVRERLEAADKTLIGAAAADLVADGESIALDASTTALSVARHLKARGRWDRLTVVTNGLRIALELAGSPGITVVMPGGTVRWEAMSVVGGMSEAVLGRINVQKAFVGAVGFTIESGLSDATEEEAQIKRSIVAVAREVIAIVDHTKWGRVAVATFCPTDRISVVVTDGKAPADMVRDLAALGIDVRNIEDEAALSVTTSKRREVQG